MRPYAIRAAFRRTVRSGICATFVRSDRVGSTKGAEPFARISPTRSSPGSGRTGTGRHVSDARPRCQTASVAFDPKAALHEYLQSGRDVLLWKLHGLSE